MLAGKLAPSALKVQQIWSIRFFLDREGRMRDRALCDFAIDSRLRGCDLVKIGTLATGPAIRTEPMVIQQKAGRSVQFESHQTREPASSLGSSEEAAVSKILHSPASQSVSE
ncbi:MAG TPA: hypothetical protein VN036_10105 [Devosia sp.]|nr:hypothetical protein [Devosia sp.]